MLEGLTDLEVAQKLAAEFKNAPDVHFILDPQSALRLVGLLQLACRHPQILKSDFELTNAVADQVKGIGPATTECINLGWDPTKDRSR